MAMGWRRVMAAPDRRLHPFWRSAAGGAALQRRVSSVVAGGKTAFRSQGNLRFGTPTALRNLS
jgi:hypothetical protein